MKWLISLFDYTGNASRPYRENGWDVSQIDIQHGQDFLEWDYKSEFKKRIDDFSCFPEVGIICMMPCTDYAVSGAKHFKRKDEDGTTAKSQLLVERFREMLNFFIDLRVVRFWQLENPRTRIHTLNPWLGKPLQKFNPCDFAGYSTSTGWKMLVLLCFNLPALLIRRELRSMKATSCKVTIKMQSVWLNSWMVGSISPINLLIGLKIGIGAMTLTK